jgi:hypothetical protein
VLARYAAGRDTDYSPELGAQFASGTVSPRTGRFSAQRRATYRRIVDLFDSYVHAGIVDLSVRGRGGGGPRPAQPAMAALAAAWESGMAGRGLAGETRGSYLRMARGYLVFLEQRGVSDLAGADGASVLAFLASLRGLVDGAGSVVLPAVPEVHRPARSGRRGEPGQVPAITPDHRGARRC